MTDVPAADIVVVGAGGTGAVVATRLSEEPDTRVLLLEAGSMSLSKAAQEAVTDGDSLRASVAADTSWSHPAELVPGRSWHLARGRGPGGSTAVNAGYFIRGRPTDLDIWHAAGGPTWEPQRVLAAYRRSERDLDVVNGAMPDHGIHGLEGPVPVKRAGCSDQLSRSLTTAALERGIRWDPDKNSFGPGGVGPVPRNVVDGIRWSTGRSYLAQATARPNLTVRGGARVLRVLLRTTTREQPHIVGLEVLEHGRTKQIRAKNIVLCAGAIGSAAILLASGIGPVDSLHAVGITTIVDLAVGERTSDHPQVAIAWRPPGPVPDDGAIVGPGVHEGDLELLPLLRPTKSLLAASKSYASCATPVLDLLVADQAPRSRGSLRPARGGPMAPPVITSGYLGTDRDRRTLRDGVRLAIDLITCTGGTPLDPALATDLDDHELDIWIRNHLGTALHLCGTARMGSPDDPLAVTDGTGQVHGVTGLWVADLSLLPAVPRRGPAATAVMMGELLASTMLA